MAAKPEIPPKPKVFSPRKPAADVDVDALAKKTYSIEISSPFASFSKQEPQFFYPVARPLHSVDPGKTSSPKSSNKWLKDTPKERRTSLPESASKLRKVSGNASASKQIPLQHSPSAAGSSQRVESGTVAEAKRKLLNHVATNNTTTTPAITSSDVAPNQLRSGMSARGRAACSNQRLSDVLSACSSIIQVELDKEGTAADNESDVNKAPLDHVAPLSPQSSKAVTNGFVGKMVAEFEMGSQDELGSSISQSMSSDAKGGFSRNSLISEDESTSDTSSEKSDAVPKVESPPFVPSVASKDLNIASEIVSTEREYLRSLKMLLEEFPAAVQGSVPADEISMLLKGLPELKLFSEQLLGDLQTHLDDYERSRQIAPVLLKKGSFLQLYVCYVKDFQKLIDTYHALKRRYPNFADSVSKFEKSPACKMLPLDEYFHKPVQRLPRYPLLLGTYLSALDENHPDRENAKLALNLVSDITAKANTSLAAIEKVSRLLWYQARTLGYTFLKPNRTFIKDGTLKKLSRKFTEERTVLLCSDAVICGEFDSFSRFTVNTEYPLNEIKVDLLDENYFDRDLEFGIYSTTKSSAFQAASIEERNFWTNALLRAIEEQQKLGLRNARNSQEVQITYAPIWIPDYRVRDCQLCKKPFGFFRRYHHCRCCGYAVCSGCSPHELEIDYKDRRPKRVCLKCFQIAAKDDERLLISEASS